MGTTPNIGLTTTSPAEDKNFLEWRTENTSDNPSSNLMKIDKKFGDLNNILDEKADLDENGKIISAQLPEMNYDIKGSAETVQDNLDEHSSNKENPHEVTAAQLGLDNVSNTSPSDNVVNYTTSDTLEPLSLGEKMSDVLSKISKALIDLISHLSDSIKHTTNEERSSWDAKANTFSTNATIVADGIWTMNSGFYIQSLSIPGILSSDNPVVDIVLNGDLEQVKSIQESWGKVIRMTSENNSITIYAEEKTMEDIPIQLKVVR